jgi:hypothetical protein
MFEIIGNMFGNTAKETVKGVAETIDALFNRFKASPEQIAQWQLERAKLEEQAAQRDANLLTKLSEIDANDRDSARKREMTIGDNTNAIMAYTITGVMFVSTVYFNIYPPTSEVKPIVENVVMALRDGWLIVVAYYFGSSQGSAAKHTMLDKLVNK